MRLPITHGALRATPGHYYWSALMQTMSETITEFKPTVTLMPNSIFMVEGIVCSGHSVFARCRTHPHGVTFFMRLSGNSLMSKGYHHIKSPLILLASEGIGLPE